MNAPPSQGCCPEGRAMRAATIAARNRLACCPIPPEPGDYHAALDELQKAGGEYAAHWTRCIKETK